MSQDLSIVMPGPHPVVFEFCRALLRAGIGVELYLPPTVGGVRSSGFKTTEIPAFRILPGLPHPRALSRYARNMAKVVISGEDFQPATLALARLLRRLGKELYVIQEKYFLSRWPLLRGIHRAYLGTAAPYVWRRAKGLIAHSRAAQEFLLDWGAPREKVTHIPAGVDATRFVPKTNPHSSGQLRILCVARLIALKNLPSLLVVANLLREAKLDFQITMVGDGPLRKDLEKRIRVMGLTHFVRILHPLPYSKMPDLYLRHDVFVLPSTIEVVGVAALEAMACGLPVIASDRGGLRDIVHNGVTGFVHHPDDAEGLAHSVLKLSDEQTRLRFSVASRDRTREKFSWDRLVEKYISFLGLRE